MKKLLFLGIGSVLMFTMGGIGSAQADNGPHIGSGPLSSVTPDGCAGCHRLHTAKTDMLTIDVQPNLCYTCHGTSGTGATTDVQDGVAYTANSPVVDGVVRSASVAGALRGGGFVNARIDTARSNQTSYPILGATVVFPQVGVVAASQPVTSSHSVDSAAVNTIWGNGAISATPNAGNPTDGSTTPNLTCGSCHNPHGNGNYRILQKMPKGGTASPGINNALERAVVGALPATSYSLSGGLAGTFGGDGTIPDASVAAQLVGQPVTPDTTPEQRATSHVYTTSDYWAQGDINAPGFITNVAEWCSTCHTRYLATRDKYGTVTSAAQRSRSDSGDATFTYRHTSSSASRNCITCHVSHGSNAATGAQSGALKNPDGSSAPGDQGTGDSRLLRIDNRGTCIVCHGKDV